MNAHGFGVKNGIAETVCKDGEGGRAAVETITA